MSELGRLEQVPLRQIWTHEATGFSNWLSQEENLKLLSDTVGLDLALEGVEQNVGPFRADVLCKASGNSDHWVLVENQIERTDHTHLGQLITYAAGLHTATIIWIAQTFREEHRAALDWLNEVTNEDISFFGLEIELWRIGSSLAAPKFNVISKPNQFIKRSQTERASTTDEDALRNAFWTELVLQCKELLPMFGNKKPSQGPWMGARPHGSDFIYQFWLYAENAVVQLRIDNKVDEGFNEQVFDNLYAHRQEIESSFGSAIEWERLDGKRSCCITRRIQGVGYRDVARREEWARQLIETMSALYNAVGPWIDSARGSRRTVPPISDA